MQKTSGNVFLGHLSEFFLFSLVALDHGCAPQFLFNVRGSLYNIQFKPYAISEMELFVTENRKYLETVVDLCYRELRLKCDRACRFDSETHR